MAQVGFNRKLEIILVRLSVGGVNADESQVLPVGVDTGASTTVIPTQVALDLGYDLVNPKEETELITASGSIPAKIITVRQLTAIGETVEDIDVVCHDLPKGATIEGLLGLNFLERFDINISFSTGTIEIRLY